MTGRPCHPAPPPRRGGCPLAAGRRFLEPDPFCGAPRARAAEIDGLLPSSSQPKGVRQVAYRSAVIARDSNEVPRAGPWDSMSDTAARGWVVSSAVARARHFRTGPDQLVLRASLGPPQTIRPALMRTRSALSVIMSLGPLRPQSTTSVFADRTGPKCQ